MNIYCHFGCSCDLCTSCNDQLLSEEELVIETVEVTLQQINERRLFKETKRSYTSYRRSFWKSKLEQASPSDIDQMSTSPSDIPLIIL